MGIRAKILSGFLILATMLLVAGAWSIYELRQVGISAPQMLEENYKSIDAAKRMTEALEREDSAILLLLLNRREEGLKILLDADEAFRKAFETAGSNVTLSGEQGYVDAVAKTYKAYRELWRTPAAGERHDTDWYFREVSPAFLTAKTAVADLMTLNQRALYERASSVEARAYRATMPGIIAIASAFIFAVVFSYLIHCFFIAPIVSLSAGIGDFLERGKPLQVQVDSEDEIARLVASVERLIKKCAP